MVVAPFGLDHTTRSVPLGSEPPLLFILSPNGSPVDLLMPRYRLENAPAVPAHVQVVPPASFSLPAVAPVQVHPPPGVVVGPDEMKICAAAGELPINRSPRIASVTTLGTAEPWQIGRASCRER